MRKGELVSRVANQVEKFGVSFTGATLDTLIQSGLVQAGRRMANDGRSPQYEFSHTHYRRCLQVLRFRRQGLLRDDSIRVALFLAGYSAAASDVREALAKENGRLLKQIIAPIRSKAAETWDEPKIGQWTPLKRTFGAADERLSNAGLVPDDEAILTLYRWARVSHLATQRGKVKNIPLPTAFAQLPAQFVDVVRKLLVAHFEGLFAEYEKPNSAKRQPLNIEVTIRQFSDSEFEQGRRAFQLIRRWIRFAPAIMEACHASEHQIGAYAPAFKALSDSMNQAEWRASIFLTAIKFAKADGLGTIDLATLEKIKPADIAALVHSWRQNC